MWRNNPAFNYEELKQYKKTKQKTATGRTETFEEWKDRLAREQDDLRVREGSKMERQERSKDMQQGVDFAKEQGLDDLGRSTDFADVRKTRDILNTRATEGLSDTEEEAIREKGMQQLQGSEQSQRRKLLSTQAQSGVRGGAAGQMQVELAAQAMNNRRALETDLILQDEQTKRAGEMNFGNFATQQAQFDLGQAAKEKLARAQSALAFAELGSNERSQIRQNIAAEKAANAKKSGGGSVLCTAMYSHGFISEGVWRADVRAGISFVRDERTRAAFYAYNDACRGLAEYCTKNYWAALLISPIIVPISKHFSDGNFLGSLLFKVAKKYFMWKAKNESK